MTRTPETLDFSNLLEPWYRGLEDPSDAQSRVLEKLLKGYSITQYGLDHRADEIGDLEGYRGNFPELNYSMLVDFLEPEKRGEHGYFLSEPPEVWVMTRGSTGTPKILPATRTHLRQIFSCGARTFVNHLKRDRELISGKVLNLSLPSRVATLRDGDRAIRYGYSSGTYSRIFPSLGDAMLVPMQEDLDRFGPGLTRKDWDRRFELIYRAAIEENISAAIGVAPVILSFARYVRKAHGKNPSDLWGLRAVICTSVRKIQTRYAPLFRKHFGDVATVEMYSATEGVFAQQLDELPYVSPNYDTYLFEVETGRGTKMLHELGRGEWGRLIVSTCMFPRYDIGDMIEAMGKNYFRVFGRAKFTHVMEHRLYKLLFKWFL